MRLISIIIPVYCEENNIRRLYDRLEKAAKGMQEYAWEYIFVNDGSHDGSFAERVWFRDVDIAVFVDEDLIERGRVRLINVRKMNIFFLTSIYFLLQTFIK